MTYQSQRPEGGNNIPDSWLNNHIERSQQVAFETDIERFIRQELGEEHDQETQSHCGRTPHPRLPQTR